MKIKKSEPERIKNILLFPLVWAFFYFKAVNSNKKLIKNEKNMEKPIDNLFKNMYNKSRRKDMVA